MTIKMMRIFAEVCKNESITLAAKIMGTSQPSVSTAIKELETQFGVKLFDRMSNRLYITEAGHQMYNQINDILMKIDELSSIKENDVQRSTIRVGVAPHFASFPYTGFLSKFYETNPDLEVITYVYSATKLEQMLLDNDLDLIITIYINSERLTKVKLGHDEFVLLCSPEYEKTISKNPTAAELSKHKFLYHDTGIKQYEYIYETMYAGGHNVIKSSDGDSLIYAALHGLGLYCVPRKQADSLVRTLPDMATYIIPQNNHSFDFVYGYHSQKLIDRSFSSFIEALEASCKTIYG